MHITLFMKSEHTKSKLTHFHLQSTRTLGVPGIMTPTPHDYMTTTKKVLHSIACTSGNKMEIYFIAWNLDKISGIICSSHWWGHSAINRLQSCYLEYIFTFFSEYISTLTFFLCPKVYTGILDIQKWKKISQIRFVSHFLLINHNHIVRKVSLL